MNILLHSCCGPCSIYPLKRIQQQGFSVSGYFYNPNVHPYKEFRRRLVAADEYFQKIGVPLIIERKYGLVQFLRAVVNNEKKRCSYCYRERLEKTAEKAAEDGFDSFSTTLLYSKYQNHQEIYSLCEKLAENHSILFYYEDFRKGWQEAIDISRELEMYRQPYCGCIYSEQERYDKNYRKAIG
ncbi:MAG: epoxyqueuosine reductase QueH [Deltaproteobacteria bacterium]|nr:epoxyqueuosine reductase QueH [Deltaproteobacteria bacterium]MBW2658426.1 epoxyqueuosine reductase QueH [Deltaproteobacteria bacterium]